MTTHFTEFTNHQKKYFDGYVNLPTLNETSVNCQMFSMNIHGYRIHFDQNTQLQTLYETLLEPYTYSNRT